MTTWKKYNLLIIGLILLIASAFLLADSSSKQAKCESIGGKIVQVFDYEKQESCENLKTIMFFAYAGLALGVALIIIQFVRKQ
jgi:hypothetical protein